jgi:20S proteasome subunit alpha 6
VVSFTEVRYLILLSEAQVNTQEYGRRPYGVGFLVIGQDASGPHLYEFSPSGTSYEYYAMSIGARSQSAKTYLEKHYEKFADCEYHAYWRLL